MVEEEVVEEEVSYHVNDHLSEGLPLFLGQVTEDITVGALQQLEGDGQVVVLQHRLVVVHQRQLGAWRVVGSAQEGRDSLVLIRYWLVRPGWSTSWIAAENRAVITSRGVNTD